MDSTLDNILDDRLCTCNLSFSTIFRVFISTRGNTSSFLAPLQENEVFNIKIYFESIRLSIFTFIFIPHLLFCFFVGS
jgi:hypothetical protein